MLQLWWCYIRLTLELSQIYIQKVTCNRARSCSSFRDLLLALVELFVLLLEVSRLVSIYVTDSVKIISQPSIFSCPLVSHWAFYYPSQKIDILSYWWVDQWTKLLRKFFLVLCYFYNIKVRVYWRKLAVLIACNTLLNFAVFLSSQSLKSCLHNS